MENALSSLAVVQELLAETRAVLAGAGEGWRSAPFTVLTRFDGAAPQAFLVSFTTSTPVIVPLIVGPNFIGRGDPHRLDGTIAYRHEHAWRRPPLVEGAQWLIDCTAVPARVADARSSNGSVLLRGVHLERGASLPKPIREWEGGPDTFNAVYRHPVPVWLGNPHPPFEWVDLSEGDVLVAMYECFVFGWLATPPPITASAIRATKTRPGGPG